MKSLLPPNSTNFEKVLEEATKFSADSSVLNGFKFKSNQQIIGYLVSEYNLNDIIGYIENPDEIIREGLVFQRTKGTKAAAKISLGWIGLEDAEIYEEPPSVHFYEFQIGVGDRQFEFDVGTLKSVLELAKPVRSRLSRVYNDLYDVRYFKLNESEFGNILSDNSGVKLYDLTLSFGRNFTENIRYSDVWTDFGTERIHEITSVADRIFRLDFSMLDDSEINTDIIRIDYQKQRCYYNTEPLGFNFLGFGRPLTFAKASIVLSEDSVFGEINSCFHPKTTVEKYQAFILGLDALSEHLWSFETEEILERFKNFINSEADCAHNEYTASARVQRDCVMSLETSASSTGFLYENERHGIASFTPGLYWHEHKHLERPWNEEDVICRMN